MRKLWLILTLIPSGVFAQGWSGVFWNYFYPSNDSIVSRTEHVFPYFVRFGSALQVGNTYGAPRNGMIRFDGSNFLGYKSGAWVPLDVQSIPSGGGWTEDAAADKVYLTTSTRKVGIGTMSPGAKLDIYSSSEAILRLRGAGNSTNFAGIKLVSDEATDKEWFILHRQEAANINKLMFYYNDGTTWYTRMTIDTLGNVGIGSTAPKGKLDIEGRYVRGSHTVSVGPTWTDVLTVDLGGSFRSARVRLFYGGADWIYHGPVRYQAEFDIVRTTGDGGAMGQPGYMVFQSTNTFYDQIQARLVQLAGTNKVNIQLRTYDAEGDGFSGDYDTTPSSSILTYEVAGNFESVGLDTGTVGGVTEIPGIVFYKGKLGVKEIVPQYDLHVNGSARITGQSDGGGGLYVASDGTVAIDTVKARSGYKFHVVGSVLCQSLTQYSLSDRKEVKGEAEINYAADRLSQVKLYRWRAKEFKHDSTGTREVVNPIEHIGPMADDPSTPLEIIATDADGKPVGIDIGSYIAFLHAAIKELNGRVKALEARLAEGRGK